MKIKSIDTPKGNFKVITETKNAIESENKYFDGVCYLSKLRKKGKLFLIFWTEKKRENTIFRFL